MQDLWAGYVKPPAQEASRLRREREHNWKRLPWVLHFSVGRKCEGKYSKQCKVPAHWAYVYGGNGFYPKGRLELLCTFHVGVTGSAMGEDDRIIDWFEKNGWERVE
jgi:hypothetical protein